MQKVCCTVGKFNSFHIGHRRLIQEAKGRCGKVLVISIKGKGRELLSERERRELVRKFGVELFDLPFKKVKDLTPEEFFKLLKSLGCNVLVVGQDWRFGKGRSGGIKEALDLGRKLGIEVVVVKPVVFEGEKVGTSRILNLLEGGKVREANRLLGYPFFVIGEVVEGRKVGREIGFPTLNIEVGRELPLKKGVYLVKVIIDGEFHFGVANYGMRPTFGGSKPILEVHLPEKDLGNLYGKPVKVEFLEFIRPELSFKAVDELKEQIKFDIIKFKKLLEEGVGNPE